MKIRLVDSRSFITSCRDLSNSRPLHSGVNVPALFSNILKYLPLMIFAISNKNDQKNGKIFLTILSFLDYSFPTIRFSKHSTRSGGVPSPLRGLQFASNLMIPTDLILVFSGPKVDLWIQIHKPSANRSRYGSNNSGKNPNKSLRQKNDEAGSICGRDY